MERSGKDQQRSGKVEEVLGEVRRAWRRSWRGQGKVKEAEARLGKGGGGGGVVEQRDTHYLTLLSYHVEVKKIKRIQCTFN